MAGAGGGVKSTTQCAVPGTPTLPAGSIPWTLMTCVPSPRFETDKPVFSVQATGARLSRVQTNVEASPSVQLMSALVELVGPAGVTVTVGELGAVVSTVQETVPAVWLTLPTASTAYTSTKCRPWLRPVSDN